MFDNLNIVGTSHISKNSVSEINTLFDSFNPDIVSVELDRNRLISLMNEEIDKSISLSSIRRIGLSGFIFFLLGRYIQKKLGSIVDMQPGADMKAAVLLAQKNKKEIFLMDRDIQVTLKRFSKAFSWKEKLQILKDLFMFPFQKKNIKIDLNKVPSSDTINMLLGELKVRYPNLYVVLIDERNAFMAKKMFSLIKKYPKKKILCVMGAGHKEGFNIYLKKLYYSNPSVSREK